MDHTIISWFLKHSRLGTENHPESLIKFWPYLKIWISKEILVTEADEMEDTKRVQCEKSVDEWSAHLFDRQVSLTSNKSRWGFYGSPKLNTEFVLC